MNRYADRAQRDASRTSNVRAGDLEDAVFITVLVLLSVAVVAGGIYLASQGL